MDLSKLAIIITHCSKDSAFIFKNIEQCLKVTKNVVLSYGDKLYDYTEENYEHFKEIKEKFDEVHMVQYSVYEKMINPLNRKSAFFHNISRIAGYQYSKDKLQCDWFLFIDSDEIPEGDALRIILSLPDLIITKNTYIFSNYWYFRDPIYQSTTFESSPLLVYKDKVNEQTLMADWERHMYLHNHQYFNTINSFGNPYTKKPIFHHYSWVRSKEKMLSKVNGWGHQGDRDWNKLIEEEFSHPFLMKDFVHGYNYNIVKNIFDLKDY